MADVAASVLARLRNKAAEAGRSYQLCLQLFCQEEFLRRLQHSPYADNLILKGGLYIYAITQFDSRVTVDVDFLLNSIPNTPEKLRPILEEIIAVQTENDFISFACTKLEPIAITRRHQGIGATIVARIKNTRTVFGIDFGAGDVIVPKSEKRSIPTQLGGFEAPVISTYSIETTIAEKLDAILSLMEFSSRLKDYYDILYLSRKFDFHGTTLTDAIAATFMNRGRNFGVEQFERLTILGHSIAMQGKWAAFLNKIKVAEVDFPQVIASLHRFLWDVIVAMETGQSFTKTWSCADSEWRL